MILVLALKFFAICPSFAYPIMDYSLNFAKPLKYGLPLFLLLLFYPFYVFYPLKRQEKTASENVVR